jgi:pyruvate dehydrogenase E2 component (dihydrolipoamide acetyltransferase)
VPAPVSGTVKAIHVQAGDKAAVGQLLLTVEMPAATAAVAQAPRTPAPATMSLASPSEHDEHKTATDKVAPRPPEPPAYTAPAPPVQSRTVEPPAPEQASKPPRPAVPAAPSVRQLAREIGVDINQVQGSGAGGRISLDDVKRYARDLHARLADQPFRGALPAVTLPDFTKGSRASAHESCAPCNRRAYGTILGNHSARDPVR